MSEKQPKSPNFEIPSFEKLEQSDKVIGARNFSDDQWAIILGGEERTFLRATLHLANFTKKDREERKVFYEYLSENVRHAEIKDEFLITLGEFLALDEKTWESMARALKRFEGEDLALAGVTSIDQLFGPPTPLQ